VRCTCHLLRITARTSVAAENPGIRVTNVHPGVVEPLMGNKALDTGAPYPIDESEGRSFTVLSNTTGRKGLC